MIVILLISLIGVCAGKAYPDTCSQSLGLEDGRITDDHITASSNFDQQSVGPHNARIRQELAGGAWCPQRQVDRLTSEWIQVEFTSPTFVSAVETQGRFGGGHGVEYAPYYRVDYWSAAGQKWITYKQKNGTQLLSGNTDTTTGVVRLLDSPVLADKVRLYPYSQYLRTVCIRLELYGCIMKEDSAPFSYSVSKSANKDDIFQSVFDSGDGVGILQDSVLGNENDVDGDKWMTWENKDLKLVTINLSFGKAQNLTAIYLHCANQRSADIAVFERAIVRFGVDRFHQRFQKKVIDYEYVADEISESVRWVRIPLNRLAGSLQLQLVFAAAKIMISEIRVQSVNVPDSHLPIDYEPTSQLVVPLRFPNTSNDPSLELAVVEGSVSNSVTLYTVEHMPSHFVTTVISITVFLIIISGLIILVVYHRARRISKAAEATAAAYASAYAGALAAHSDSVCGTMNKGNTYSTNQRRVFVKQPLSNTQSNSTYLIHLDNHKNSYLEAQKALMPTISPPPNRPCPKSPPPEYKSPLATSDEDSSEYADADFPDKCNSETALLGVTDSTYSQQYHPYMPLSSQSISQSSMTVSTFKPTTSRCEPVSYGLQSSCIQEGVEGIQQPTTSNTTLLEIDVNELQFVEKIGEGQFGEVHLCSWRNQLVACKFLTSLKHDFGSMKRMNRSEDTWRECMALSRLHHVNIIRVIGVCTHQAAIIQEYARHGDLNQHLRTADMPSSSQLYTYASDIAAGMAYLASQCFIHRDLATRNCLLADDGSIKISDFGMARSLYSSDYYKIEGSFVLPIRWMSVESLLMGKFTHASDVWSFGVTLWEMMGLCASQPYADMTDEQVITNIQCAFTQRKLPVSLSCPVGCPPDVYRLMTDCWNINASQRPTFIQIHSILLAKLSATRQHAVPSSFI